MDTELFEQWLKNHFLLYAPPARPLLLLLDGHTSHQLDVLRIAAAEGVIIFCLPPHATHILQPLHNGAFGALKQHWSEACHRCCSKNPGKVVNRYNLCEVFHSAWVEGMAMIIASFRVTGIYPPARDVVLSQIPGKSNDSQPHQSVRSACVRHKKRRNGRSRRRRTSERRQKRDKEKQKKGRRKQRSNKRMQQRTERRQMKNRRKQHRSKIRRKAQKTSVEKKGRREMRKREAKRAQEH